MGGTQSWMNECREMRGVMKVPGRRLSPDDGGETVNQELLLLLGDRGPLVRGFFLRSRQLLPGQLPGTGRDILSALGKPPCWGWGHEQWWW